MLEFIGNKEVYQQKRDLFSTGDIVLFSDDSFIGKLIRKFTGETFSHMGLVWAIEQRVFIIEAFDGNGVLVRPLSQRVPFYHLKTAYNFTIDQEEFMLSKVGSNYSYLDAILSGLGFKTKKDDNYQCAEFVSLVYGLDEDTVGELTPGNVFKFFMKGRNL